MPETERLAGIAEGEGFIAAAIVGHHPLDRHAEPRVEGDRGVEEGYGADGLLVGPDLGESDARVIVDTDVDILPTDPAAVALAGPVAGDAVADALETSELLDIDVDQLSGALSFVATHGLGGLQVAQPAQSQPPENPAHGGRRDAQFGGDPLARPALPPQGRNALDNGVRCGAMKPVRARGPVPQPGPTLGLKPGHPLAYGLRTDAQRRGDLARGLAKIKNTPHKFRSTQRRQASILMTVHPVLRGTLKHHNSSFLGPDRMDNLLKAHI
jgi:hypothetical protein